MTGTSDGKRQETTGNKAVEVRVTVVSRDRERWSFAFDTELTGRKVE